MKRRKKPLAAKRPSLLEAKQISERVMFRLTGRKPIARVGSVAKREKPAIAAFRDAVLDRAQGWCERCSTPQKHLEAHHLTRRSRCPGWDRRHDPDLQGAAVCFACHRSLDLDPDDVGGPLEARARRSRLAFEAWRADRDMLAGNPGKFA